MSFGCERSCSNARRVSNFNSKVPRGGGGGIYPHITFERDRLNIVEYVSSKSVHVDRVYGRTRTRYRCGGG